MYSAKDRYWDFATIMAAIILIGAGAVLAINGLTTTPMNVALCIVGVVLAVVGVIILAIKFRLHKLVEAFFEGIFDELL